MHRKSLCLLDSDNVRIRIWALSEIVEDNIIFNSYGMIVKNLQSEKQASRPPDDTRTERSTKSIINSSIVIVSIWNSMTWIDNSDVTYRITRLIDWRNTETSSVHQDFSSWYKKDSWYREWNENSESPKKNVFAHINKICQTHNIVKAQRNSNCSLLVLGSRKQWDPLHWSSFYSTNLHSFYPTVSSSFQKHIFSRQNWLVQKKNLKT